MSQKYDRPTMTSWTHAVIGGEHKCLRAGQFCARRHESDYRRHGFTGQGRLKRR